MATDPLSIPGIHHVTAIASDAQTNIEFYCGVLGLRLVKLTVNFDDPGSYHLYYGDELGRPGTIITFFAWPGATRGKIGAPQATATAYAVPKDSIDFWSARLLEKGIQVSKAEERFGEPVLKLSDPDGLQIEVVGAADLNSEPWSAGPVPLIHAIRGFHGVTLAEEGYEKTSGLLTDLMQYEQIAEEQNRFRYRPRTGDKFASTVDLLCTPGGNSGSLGAGVVHHVAFRTDNDATQLQWRAAIARAGYNVSPMMDRTYFHSIYFREPGGVLFEIATNQPGFTADESAANLGTKLMLPPWLESRRPQIEMAVPPIRRPTAPQIHNSPQRISLPTGVAGSAVASDRTT